MPKVQKLEQPNRNGATEEPKPAGFTFYPDTPDAFFVPLRTVIAGSMFITIAAMKSDHTLRLQAVDAKVMHIREFNSLPTDDERARYIEAHRVAFEQEMALMQEVVLEKAALEDRLAFEADLKLFLWSLDYSDFRVRDESISADTQTLLKQAEKQVIDDPATCTLLLNHDLEEMRRLGSDFRRRVGVRA